MRKNILSIIALLFLTTSLVAQGTQVEFGKNRVQYHDDFNEWLEYDSPNFTTYWYGKSRNVGQAVVQMAEMDHDAIQNILEHRINDKIQLIVYADLTDLKQSNIGVEEAFFNTAGQTKIVGNKVFVYFNGDHNHLRRQIREGIASVYLSAMLFGSNLQEIVQNAVMMNLPSWFEKGLVSYIGSDWDTDMDNQMKDAFLREDFDTFDEFAEEYPQLAGHSLWYFIGQNYGKTTVSNLLYLTRINRSIQSGFLYVLGSNYQRVTDSWKIYFTERYKEDLIGRDELTENRLAFKNKRKLPITQFKLSPDGSKAVYVTNEIGKYKVYLHDLQSGEKDVLLKEGFRNAFQATDYNYPLLAWKPSGFELSIITERRDIIKYTVYDLNTKESITDDLDPQYQRVISADFIDNNNLVFSAMVNGYSDLFLYQTNTRQTQRITNDFYDDLDAKVVQLENKKGILWSSNRQEPLLKREKLDSILPIGDYDIFYYDMSTRSQELVQVTNTPFIDERHPVSIDTTWFAYTSLESGINNRKVGYLKDVFTHNNQYIYLEDGTEIILHEDSTLSKLDTTLIDSINIVPVFEKRAFVHNNSNYTRNILEQHIASRTNKLSEVIYKDGHYQLFVRDVDIQQVVPLTPTRYQAQRISIWQSLNSISSTITNENNLLKETETIEVIEPIGSNTNPPATTEDPEEEEEKIDIDNYMFQSEFDDDETPATVEIEEEKGEIILETNPAPIAQSPLTKENSILKFNPSRIIPYRLKFRTDYITTNLDNSLLFGGLDTYAGDRQQDNFRTPPPGILFKANFKDLFEDFQVEGGVRLPTTFNGAEYFLVFDDRKGHIDWRYAAYRKTLKSRGESSTSFQPLRGENVTLLGMVQAKYPLDIFTSIRAIGTLRNDRSALLATEKVTLAEPLVNESRAGLRLEYVFDNTLDVSLNIKNGTRYKVFGEVVKRFQLDLLDEVNVSFNDGFMTVLGVDARHYQRLDKRSILAVRFAAATSFGSEKILYYMGGVDGWLFPRFDEDVPQPLNDDFAYQTLAANMRGFSQNIRNGGTYALINAELRVPVIQYLFKRNLRSAFLRNFQVVGFFDTGTAWQGLTPFSDDNPLNIVSFIGEGGSPVNVKVNYFRDPIVAGYGVGVRSTLFGYFIRVDYAWGIETRQVRDPRFFIALGTDF